MGYQKENSFDEACTNNTGSHCRLERRDLNIPNPADFGTANPQACLSACLGQILISNDIGDVCHQLQLQRDNPEWLRSLYCCDFNNCGVWIDRPGQSPNVDLIINRCQNNGYYSIPDPGPPSWDSCPSDAPGDAQPALPTGTTEPQETGLRTFSRLSGTSTTDASSSPLSTYAPSLDSPRPSSSTTSAVTSSATASAGLTAGSKAAIGICTSLGVIALALLLIFMFRRRRRDIRSYLGNGSTVTRHSRSFSAPPSGSRTSLTAPLMTPTSASSRNAPCTPPARLSDRKYLALVFNQGLPRSPSTPSGAEKPAFPVSPIFAPTSSKLIPRHERRATTNSIRFPLPSLPPVYSHYPRSSIYSLSSGLGASTTTFNSNKGDSEHSGTVTVTNTSTPPLSPTRPPRPHNGPLEVPDPVAPSGPPPSRALPPPPPSPARHNHSTCASPTFPVSPVSPASPTFPARPIVLGGSPVIAVYQHADNKVHYEPAIGIAVPRSPPRSPPPPPPRPPLLPLPPPAVAVTAATPVAAKELCDLTESYARERETRDSWGSWSGAGCGGGGPGVSPIGAGRKRGSDGSSRGSADRKGSANATVMALRELDLEKLGGRY